MKWTDIRVGEPHAVEYPQAEDGVASRYSGRPKVKATPAEVGVVFKREYRGEKSNGVRCTLDEPLRVWKLGAPRRELPVGHEFIAESRQVFPYDASAAEVTAERAKRYAEQDAIRAAFGRLGLPEARPGRGFDLRGDEVSIDRGVLASWLRRMDPIDAVRDAFAELGDADFADVDSWREAADRVLEEVAQGMAVTDAEMAVRCAPDPESF